MPRTPHRDLTPASIRWRSRSSRSSGARPRSASTRTSRSSTTRSHTNASRRRASSLPTLLRAPAVQLIRDAGFDPLYVGGLGNAPTLEAHIAFTMMLGAGEVGPYFYRFARPAGCSDASTEIGL